MGDRLGIHDVVDIFLCYIWLILSLAMLTWSLGYYYRQSGHKTVGDILKHKRAFL